MTPDLRPRSVSSALERSRYNNWDVHKHTPTHTNFEELRILQQLTNLLRSMYMCVSSIYSDTYSHPVSSTVFNSINSVVYIHPSILSLEDTGVPNPVAPKSKPHLSTIKNVVAVRMKPSLIHCCVHWYDNFGGKSSLLCVFFCGRRCKYESRHALWDNSTITCECSLGNQAACERTSRGLS